MSGISALIKRSQRVNQLFPPSTDTARRQPSTTRGLSLDIKLTNSLSLGFSASRTVINFYSE